MSLAVMNDDLAKIEGGDTLQACDVHPELIRVRSALVVRVDPAAAAEMVLGDAGVETIGGELVLSLGDAEKVRR